MWNNFVFHLEFGYRDNCKYYLFVLRKQAKHVKLSVGI